MPSSGAFLKNPALAQVVCHSHQCSLWDRRTRNGVVVPDDLDVPPVPRSAGVRHEQAVERQVLRATRRESCVSPARKGGGGGGTSGRVQATHSAAKASQAEHQDHAALDADTLCCSSIRMIFVCRGIAGQRMGSLVSAASRGGASLRVVQPPRCCSLSLLATFAPPEENKESTAVRQGRNEAGNHILRCLSSCSEESNMQPRTCPHSAPTYCFAGPRCGPTRSQVACCNVRLCHLTSERRTAGGRPAPLPRRSIFSKGRAQERASLRVAVTAGAPLSTASEVSVQRLQAGTRAHPACAQQLQRPLMQRRRRSSRCPHWSCSRR